MYLNCSILYYHPVPNTLHKVYQYFFLVLYQKQISHTNMTLEWDTAKPIAMNEKSWHCKQIAKFLDVNPKRKPFWEGEKAVWDYMF